jgi:hypothetical protein
MLLGVWLKSDVRDFTQVGKSVHTEATSECIDLQFSVK